MSEKPTDTFEFTNPYKRPKYLPPTNQEEAEQKKDLCSPGQRLQYSSEKNQKTSPPQSEQLRKQVLSLQLTEQQRVGEQLRFLLQQVLKTQAGLHLNPQLFQKL